MPWYGWIAIVAGIVALLALAQWRGWIELRGVDNGRGSGNGMFGFADEVFHPTKHEAMKDLAQQTELPAPRRRRATARSTSTRGACGSISTTAASVVG